MEDQQYSLQLPEYHWIPCLSHTSISRIGGHRLDEVGSDRKTYSVVLNWVSSHKTYSTITRAPLDDSKGRDKTIILINDLCHLKKSNLSAHLKSPFSDGTTIIKRGKGKETSRSYHLNSKLLLNNSPISTVGIRKESGLGNSKIEAFFSGYRNGLYWQSKKK